MMRSGCSAGVVAAVLAWITFVSEAALPTCVNPDLRFTEDYAWAIGSAGYLDADGDLETGSTFRLAANGTNLAQGTVAEGLLLHFDGQASGQGGENALVATGVAYTSGKWNSALMLNTNGGNLRYSRDKNLSLAEGTIELWVALRAPGTHSSYTNIWQPLWHYYVSGSEYLVIAQAGDSGVIYAGGVVGGQWQSAYGSAASMRNWAAGEWHHLAFTYSAASNFMRFYLDGRLVADSNEGHYWAPSTNASYFCVGCDRWGTVARYLIDEFRVSGRALTDAEIRARALRAEPARPNEIWLSATNLPTGAALAYEFTPANGAETGATCNATLIYPGIPLLNPSPPSTLLPPGTTLLPLSLQTVTNTECRYALSPLPFDQMLPFGSGAGTTNHQVAISGLNTDTLNHVYVRCAAFPDYALHLRYRCLTSFNPRFPRTGNLWGWGDYYDHPLPDLAKIDLWLGAGMSPEMIRTLRQANPDVLVLTSINAIENTGLPSDYYFKDIYGNRVEVWPGAWRLNVTKPHVAEYQARLAAQLILDSDLMFDGCFFDNVMLQQSWVKADIYGNPFRPDYNEDGVEDNLAELDAAWRAGVLYELDVFRQLMPHALMSGHAMALEDPGITNRFHGISIGFHTADVIEGERGFATLWAEYAGWCGRARGPRITMIESSPLDDIAYGYDYSPWDKIPPATLEFARDYYPCMRFGLALTLMQDGYFAHEYGDTWHGNDWWYDELDFDLGYPLGPAEWLSQTSGSNLLVNAGFEIGLPGTWNLWADTANGYTAVASRTSTGVQAGAACARIDITATGGEDWRVDFAQFNRSLRKGIGYEVIFWARASAPRPITLAAQKGSPDWRSYGLRQTVQLGTNWTQHQLVFSANETTTESRLQFMLGATTGTVWLDEVQLRERGPDIYQREFDHGLVLLNGSRQEQTIHVGPGFRRLTGAQASRFQSIVDNADTNFLVSGAWTVVTNDSGEWKATGPFYHDWGANSYLSGAGTTNLATWTLVVPTNDPCTIQVWWPAVPGNSWSQAVLYEVWSGTSLLASATMDQRTGGDQWHTLASGVSFASSGDALVRARATDGLPFLADALHLYSASRYNDGSAAASVTLQPMDGIVLARDPGTFADRDRDGLPDYWEQAHFGNPTNAVPTEDPDHDGTCNFLEYALNMLPQVVDPGGKPQARWNAVAQGLDYTFLRMRPELTYVVQTSTDLVNWTNAFVNPGTPGQLVTVPYAPGTRAGFLRLRVSR